MTYTASACFLWSGGGKSGATVDLWATSRFTSQPAENQAPPSGNPDAGPVTTGTAAGNPGAWEITGIATAQDYYVRVQYGGNTYWGLYPEGQLAGLSPVSSQGGSLIFVPGTSPPSSLASASANGITIQFDTGAAAGASAWEVFDHLGNPIAGVGPTGGVKVYGDRVQASGGTVFGPFMSLDGTTNPASILGPSSTYGAGGRIYMWPDTPTNGWVSGTTEVGDLWLNTATSTWYICTTSGAGTAAGTWATVAILGASTQYFFGTDGNAYISRGNDGFGNARLQLYTNGSGGAETTTLSAAGLYPSTPINLGTSLAQWKNLYAQDVIEIANTVAVASNAGTVPVTWGVNNFTNSSASPMTITMATSGAVDGQISTVRIYDYSNVAQAITWVNTENSTQTDPGASLGSTVHPRTATFQFNASTSLWRCIASDTLTQSGQVIGRTIYAPTTNTAYSLVASSTGLTCLDATNLGVTFVAPSSGSVKVKLQGLVAGGAAAGSAVVFGVTSTTVSPGAVAGSTALVYRTPTGTAVDNEQLCVYEQVITGLTAGSSYTFYFAAMYSGTACSVNAQSSTSQTAIPTGAPAMIEVSVA